MKIGDMLEPAAKVLTELEIMDDTAVLALSQAVSLKRIADSLEKLAGGEVPFFLSEQHFWSLGQSFGQGKGAAG